MSIDSNILSIKNVRLQCEKYNDLYGTYSGSVKELLFIETDGNQFIDTGYKPSNTTRVIFDMYIAESQSRYPMPIFGARNGTLSGGTGAEFCLWANDATHYRDDYGTHEITNIAVRPFGRLNIDKDRNNIEIADSYNSHTEEIFTTSVSMFLFGLNSSQVSIDQADTRRVKGKFFSCKIYDNGNLVRYFIPAEKNGVIGVFDKKYGIFYANSGSGTFKAGPERNIPKEYEEIEYLQSDATSATNGPYINTGINASNNAVIISKFQYVSVGKWLHGALFGGRDDNSYTNRLCFGHNNNNNGFRFDYRNKNVGLSKSSEECLSEFIFSSFDDRAVLSDGSEINVNSSGTYTGDYPIYLFSIDTRGASSNCGNVRIYYFYIETATGSRYFIPVKRRSDGALGMYDLETATFFQNSGTSTKTFSGGNSIQGIGFPYISIKENEETSPAYLNLIDDYGQFVFDRSLGNREISSKNLKYIFNKLYAHDKSLIENIYKEPQTRPPVEKGLSLYLSFDQYVTPYTNPTHPLPASGWTINGIDYDFQTYYITVPPYAKLKITGTMQAYARHDGWGSSSDKVNWLIYLGDMAFPVSNSQYSSINYGNIYYWKNGSTNMGIQDIYVTIQLGNITQCQVIFSPRLATSWASRFDSYVVEASTSNLKIETI